MDPMAATERVELVVVGAGKFIPGCPVRSPIFLRLTETYTGFT